MFVEKRFPSTLGELVIEDHGNLQGLVKQLNATEQLRHCPHEQQKFGFHHVVYGTSYNTPWMVTSLSRFLSSTVLRKWMGILKSCHSDRRGLHNKNAACSMDQIY